MAELGGLRHARRDSTNTAWRNLSFRGFADYMQTPEFEEALDQLTHWAQKRRTVIMCAEAVPWRCHRSMIGDALLARAYEWKKSRAGRARGPTLLRLGPCETEASLLSCQSEEHQGRWQEGGVTPGMREDRIHFTGIG